MDIIARLKLRVNNNLKGSTHHHKTNFVALPNFHVI